MVAYPDHYDADLFKLAVTHISDASKWEGLHVLAQATDMTHEEFTAAFITGDHAFSASQQERILKSAHTSSYSEFYKEGDKAAKAIARDELAKEFGDKLRAFRIRRKQTQEELAATIEINPYLIHIFEDNGHLLSAKRADKQSFSHIFKLIATHVNDPEVSAALEKIQNFENRPAASIIESIRATRWSKLDPDTLEEKQFTDTDYEEIPLKKLLPNSVERRHLLAEKEKRANSL